MQWFLLMAIFSIILSGCAIQEEEQPAQDKETVVSTYPASKESYSPELHLSGTVFANREANLGAGFPGKVENIIYPEGTWVKKDQLLVEMAGEMLAQAEAEYLTLQKDYERVARLVKNGTITQQEYDHVKARFDASKAKYELAQKNTQIRAPFSGTIVDYLVNEGENYFLNLNMEPGYSNTSGILRLMQLDPVKVKVEVNEGDLAKIEKGTRALVRVDAFPQDEFHGEVTLIKPYLSTRTRSASIEISIPNPDTRLKPGMFARVNLQLPDHKAVFVPMEAIYRDPETDKELVHVVKNNMVETRETGRISEKDDRVVLTNIFDGDEVIIGGKNRVNEGDKVSIINNGGRE